MTYRIFLQTCIASGMSHTNVTAPPGLNVCYHLWEASWAFASVSISQTVIRPENSYALPTFYLPRRFFYASISFTSAATAPLASFFLLSLLTSLHPPHHLSCIRWDQVWSFSLLSPRQGIESACEFCACDGSQCQRLVGSSSLLDFLFPPPVTLSLCWMGSICWVSVRLPPNPHKDPLTLPQVHLEYNPSGTHLVLHRWTSLV